MDIDDYESLNEEFKVVNSRDKRLHFFTSDEMMKDITIPKDEVSHDEMVGDASRGKSIKNSRPAVYDIHTATSSANTARPRHSQQQSHNQRKEVNYRICPICSGPVVRSCNCNNHDSVCENSHKWHVKNGKLILGHSH